MQVPIPVYKGHGAGGKVHPRAVSHLGCAVHRCGGQRRHRDQRQQKGPADKNKLVPDPEAASVVRQIFQWSLEGYGRQRIAGLLNQQGIPNPTRYKAERGWTCNHPVKNDFGLWNKTTVGRILTNEMCTGIMVQGRRKKVSYKSKVVIDTPRDQWYRVEGAHEAVIDRDTFEAVQRGLRTKTDGSGEARLLSGLVKCADCGSTMSKCSNGKQSYLRCKLYADSGKQRLCTRHSIRLDRLVEVVSERIRHYVRTCCVLDLEAIQPEKDARREALEQERKAPAGWLDAKSWRAVETEDRPAGVGNSAGGKGGGQRKGPGARRAGGADYLEILRGSVDFPRSFLGNGLFRYGFYITLVRLFPPCEEEKKCNKQTSTN